jgi:hypothetical protein
MSLAPHLFINTRFTQEQLVFDNVEWAITYTDISNVLGTFLFSLLPSRSPKPNQTWADPDFLESTLQQTHKTTEILLDPSQRDATEGALSAHTWRVQPGRETGLNDTYIFSCVGIGLRLLCDCCVAWQGADPTK